ncbi:MAG: N-acetyltransferase [Oscillospiraceae bacterium]|nr:N-acetyltransferase [Oscillospiraceae bacterium]
MEYTIACATMAELPELEKIYEFAREFMAQTGNPNQWGTTHPPTAQLIVDIQNSRLFTVKSGENIHGVFYFCVEEDPTYAEIYQGKWHENKPYGVIHRIASDGSGGILKAAVAYGSRQVDYLRIDTHADNYVMRKAVTKLGFRYCGIIYIADGTPRLAYDRVNL